MVRRALRVAVFSAGASLVVPALGHGPGAAWGVPAALAQGGQGGAAPPPGGADARARAEVPFKEGVALHDAGKDAEALAKFEEAYRIFPSANILFNVARMEQVVGRSGDALKHFRACLKDPQLSFENRSAAESHVRNLERSLAKVQIDAPAGAKVRVDDGDAEDTKDPVLVVPGKHKLEVTQGGKREVRDVVVGAGEIAVVKFTLAPSGNAGAGSGALTSAGAGSGNPGSAGDGASAGAGDAGAAGASGTYWTTGHTAGILAMAGGLVATGVGIAFVAAANAAADKVTASKSAPGAPSSCAGVTSPACAERASDEDDRVRDTNFAAGFLVTGGVLLVGGAIAYFAWPSGKGGGGAAGARDRSAGAAGARDGSGPREADRPRVAPVVGQGMLGVSFGGEW